MLKFRLLEVFGGGEMEAQTTSRVVIFGWRV